MIRFSVVIPTFNSSETIKRAIDSVVNQSYPPHELIIVDDASQDNTLQIVKILVEPIKQFTIRLICLDTNRGPAHARNLGWDVATGDYVAFLDSDDEWLPDKLLVQEWSIKQTGAVLIGQTYPSLNKFRVPIFRVDKKDILIRNFFWTSTVVVKRSVTERFYEPLRRCEDHLLFCRLTLVYECSYYISHPLIIEHKEPIGAGGLSKSIIQMQIGNWRLYYILFRERYVSLVSFILLEIISTTKFAVRPFRLAWWRIKRSMRRNLMNPYTPLSPKR
jgi:glycosyltransferase involved in cell wall biosynthesis